MTNYAKLNRLIIPTQMVIALFCMVLRWIAVQTRLCVGVVGIYRKITTSYGGGKKVQGEGFIVYIIHIMSTLGESWMKKLGWTMTQATGQDRAGYERDLMGRLVDRSATEGQAGIMAWQQVAGWVRRHFEIFNPASLVAMCGKSKSPRWDSCPPGAYILPPYIFSTFQLVVFTTT